MNLLCLKLMLIYVWYTIRWLQFANADYIQEKKIGIKFLIDAFSEEMLINGIMEVRI